MKFFEVFKIFENINEFDNLNLKELFENDNQMDQNNQTAGDRKISDDQAAQIAQGLQSGEIKEEEIKQAYDQGQLTDADIQAIQSMLQNQNIDELPPEEQEKIFEKEIEGMTDNFIRLNLFDKINELSKKIENFIDNSNDEKLIEKFKLIKNYLDILEALIFNLDVNLIYQLYVTLELKTIEFMKERLGLNTDYEKEYLKEFEDRIIVEDLKEKYYPVEKLIEKIKNGEATEEILKKLIKYNIYSEEEIDEILNQIQQDQNQDEANSEQDQNENQMDPQQEKIEAAAQAIASGQSSFEELLQMLKDREIDKYMYDEIRKRAEELMLNSDQAQQSDQAQLEQSQVQQNTQDTQEDQNQPKIDESQAQQIALGILNGEIKEEEIKQALDNGELTPADIELIQQFLQQSNNPVS